MKIKELLEGYYEGRLTDAEEEQLEMLMLSGNPEIPEDERRLYLGVSNIPSTSEQPVRNTHKTAWRVTTVAASIALIIGLGTFAYIEQQKQLVTQEEILEMAMGNFGQALHKSDTTREQFANIIHIINADTTFTLEEENSEETHNPKEI